MIEVIKQIEQDWYIIHLTGTTYYQIWNKNDLHETLLEAGYIKLGKEQKCTTIWIDNFDEDKVNWNDLVNKLKNNK